MKMKTPHLLALLALIGAAPIASATDNTAPTPKFLPLGADKTGAAASKPVLNTAMPPRELNTVTATLGADGQLRVECHDEPNPEFAAAVEARRSAQRER